MRLVCFIFVLLGLTQMVMAQEISDDRIKKLAIEAILENPQVIMEAVAILKKRESDQAASGTKSIRLKLESDPGSPNLGNINGDVTVIEFFDYNCGYCRQAGKTIQALIASDPNIRVIFREWPVLGEGSTFAARAVLASAEQGKYEEFHWALMNGKVRATKAGVMKIARDLGLDISKLEADMVSSTVDGHLEKSNILAQNLGFTGTPAFIVGNQKVPGMISFNQISELVAETRATSLAVTD